MAPDGDPADALIVHSSWRGLIGGGLSSLGLVAAGTYGVASGGWGVVPTALLVVGVVLAAVMFLDFPVAARFDAVGVQRRMLLRRQLIEWARVSQITRQRPRVLRVDRSLLHGALAVAVGSRRYLLIDRAESGAEYDELQRLADRAGFADKVALLLRPSDSVPPTWLYRRRTWRPKSGSHG